MRLRSLKEQIRFSRRDNVPRRLVEREAVGKWGTLLAIYAVSLLLISPLVLVYLLESVGVTNFRPAEFRVPEEINDPVFASVDFTFRHRASVEAWMEERERQHDQIYVFDPGVREEIISETQDLLDRLSDLASENNDEAIRQELSREGYDFGGFTDETLRNFSLLARDQRFRDALIFTLQEAYGRGIVSNQDLFFSHRQRNVVRLQGLDLTPVRADWPTRDAFAFPLRRAEWEDALQDRFMESRPTGIRLSGQELLDLSFTLLQMKVRPNVERDEAASLRARENYPEGNLDTTYQAGDQLVPSLGVFWAAPGRTYLLTDEDKELLEAHWRTYLGEGIIKESATALMILVIYGILGLFISRFRRDFQFSTRNILLISLPILLALFLGRILLFLADGDPSAVGYAFPAGVIGMLGVLLLDFRMAIMLVTWGCLLFGLQVDLAYEYVIVGLFGGYVAVAALSEIRDRHDVISAGFQIGIANFIVIMLLNFIESPGDFALTAAFIGAVAGFSCSLITLAILPVFEFTFDIITDMKLLEMTGLEHPLLRHMEDVAPGTWQHTLNVSKLAEAAAKDIGINYLLIRAGCYYHDIGKTKRPEYFTENQVTAEDKRRHDELNPQMSVLIIRNHVKEGIEIARQWGLPQRIIDFIEEHHGTSVIAYFYHKAKQQQEAGIIKDTVREEDYCYPHRKPQSIETAVVMLADTVEATATAKLSGKTVRDDEIEQIVRNTIFTKFNEGQFDECNLTMRDLNTIRECFVRTLKSRFHTRIDYPKAGPSSMSRIVQRPNLDENRDGAKETEKTQVIS